MKKLITILAALAICLATVSVATAGSSGKHGSSRSSGSRAKSGGAGRSAHQARRPAGSAGRKQGNVARKAGGNRSSRSMTPRRGAAGSTAKHGSNRSSRSMTKSMGAGKSAHQGRKTAALAGHKPGKAGRTAGGNRVGKQKNGTGHTQRNKLQGAKGGHNATARHGVNGRHDMKGGRNSSLNHGKTIYAGSTNRFNEIIGGIPYTSVATGFLIGGSDRFLLAGGYELDPGDTIVSVGEIDCADSTMVLPDLVDQAYEEDALVMVIRKGISGDLIEVELPSGDSN